MFVFLIICNMLYNIITHLISFCSWSVKNIWEFVFIMKYNSYEWKFASGLYLCTNYKVGVWCMTIAFNLIHAHNQHTHILEGTCFYSILYILTSYNIHYAYMLMYAYYTIIHTGYFIICLWNYNFNKTTTQKH